MSNTATAWGTFRNKEAVSYHRRLTTSTAPSMIEVKKIPVFSWTWVFLVQLVAASKITLPQNWAVSNNGTEEYSIVGEAKFTYLSSEGYKIQSENKTFSLGFVRHGGSDLYTLSIIMMGENAESHEIGMQVWSANRDHPVKLGATLSFNSNGTLELLDSDKTLAWSPQIKQTKQIASMELLDTGNFVLYDDTNNTLWQSFEHPTNVFLPGQKLTLGMKLVSNFSSSNSSSGYYSMVMEANGATFYENLSNTNPTPYSAWTLWGVNVKPTNPPCSLYQAVLIYNTSGTFVEAVNNTGSNRNSSQICEPLKLIRWTYDNSISSSCSATCRRFSRLESDGNLGGYIYFDISKRWRASYNAFQTCQLPGSCGSYGICSTSSQCTCPNDNGDNWISFTNSSEPSKGCTAKSRLDCSSGSHRLHEVIGVNYVSNSLLEPLQGIQNVEACKTSCLSNCSCKAAFFLNYSLSCYQIENVRTMYQSGNNSDLAFLKVQEKKKSSKSLILGLTIGLGIPILVICFLIWLRIRKETKGPTAALREEEAALKELPGLPPRFSLKDLEMATNMFSKKLGSGGFGTVYEGTLPDGRLVAIKRLENNVHVVKQFLAEVATLGGISHINLVRLCGFCLDEAHHLLVYELVSNSSLDRWLFKEDKKVLNWDTRYCIALDTARGLAYLHEECRDPIIHLDIKPQNILLDHDFTAKVADFGLSKLIQPDESLFLTSIGGTAGYIAPEAATHSIVTKKCDVYSYGVVVFELMAGRKQFLSDPEVSVEMYLPSWAVLKLKEDKIEAVVDPRLEGMFNKREAFRLLQIALLCIQDDPSSRPSMAEIVRMLEGNVALPPVPASIETQVMLYASNAAKALEVSY